MSFSLSRRGGRWPIVCPKWRRLFFFERVKDCCCCCCCSEIIIISMSTLSSKRFRGFCRCEVVVIVIPPLAFPRVLHRGLDSGRVRGFGGCACCRTGISNSGSNLTTLIRFLEDIGPLRRGSANHAAAEQSALSPSCKTSKRHFCDSTTASANV